MSRRFCKVCNTCGEEKGNNTNFCHNCSRCTDDRYIEEPEDERSQFVTPKPEYPLRMAESYTPLYSQERKTRLSSWSFSTPKNLHENEIDLERVKQSITKLDPELVKRLDKEIQLEHERVRKITNEMNTKYPKQRDIFSRNMDSMIESIIVSVQSAYPAVEFDYHAVEETTMDYTLKYTFIITFPKHQLSAEEFEIFISKKGYYVVDQIHVLIPERVINPKVDGNSYIKSRKNYNQYTLTFECPATLYDHLVKG